MLFAVNFNSDIPSPDNFSVVEIKPKTNLISTIRIVPTREAGEKAVRAYIAKWLRKETEDGIFVSPFRANKAAPTFVAQYGYTYFKGEFDTNWQIKRGAEIVQMPWPKFDQAELQRIAAQSNLGNVIRWYRNYEA